MSQADTTAARRFRLASPGTALVAAGIILALIIAGFPLAAMAHQNADAGGGGAPVWLSTPFAVIGFVLAWRKPRNRLGWILLGFAVSSELAQDGSFYVVAGYRLRHGGLPFGWVALLAQPAWSVSIIMLGLAILLFPDGHLPFPWLRWVLRPTSLALVVTAAAVTTVSAARGTRAARAEP